MWCSNWYFWFVNKVCNVSGDGISTSIEELELVWIELKNNNDELIGDVEV